MAKTGVIAEFQVGDRIRVDNLDQQQYIYDLVGQYYSNLIEHRVIGNEGKVIRQEPHLQIAVVGIRRTEESEVLTHFHFSEVKRWEPLNLLLGDAVRVTNLRQQEKCENYLYLPSQRIDNRQLFAEGEVIFLHELPYLEILQKNGEVAIYHISELEEIDTDPKTTLHNWLTPLSI
jgi:hypothetical protein